ncbi:cadherin-like domain-containing protein [Variovorax robiniae]|uniref:Cadherin-like domain-containing protein n=1 Tax=Variovorax robiniae TaxID=1836199 RepID=A0ABU8X8B2_9BURK
MSIGGVDFALDANKTQVITVGSDSLSVAHTTAGGFVITKSGGGVMSQASLDALIRGITYRQASSTATAGDRTLTFTLTDVGGAVSPAAVAKISVVPGNHAPVAGDDSLSTNEDTALALNLLANDTDADGDALHIASINGVAITPGAAQDIAVPHGTVKVAANGSMTFVADADYNGPVAFDYVVADTAGATGTGHVAIAVKPVNDAPVATADTGTIAEDKELTVPASSGLLANDRDVDGDTLAVSGFTVAGIAGSTAPGQAMSIPNVGVLTINADGGYTFVPARDFNGAVPTITYTVSDGQGGTATATLNLVVMSVNDAPVLDLDAGGSAAEPLSLTGSTSGGNNDPTAPNTFGGNGTTTGTFNSPDGATSSGAPSTFDFAFTPTAGAASSVESVINLNTIDSTFRITVNGQNIWSGATEFEVEFMSANMLPTSTGLKFVADPSVQMTEFWEPNANGLPRVQVRITADGIEFWGTSTPTSTTLERMMPASGTFAAPGFVEGVNHIALTFFDIGDSTASGTVTVADRPHDYAASYTENGAGVSIAAPAAMVSDVDSANMQSATITLTNKQAGDLLQVNGSSAASGTVNGLAYTLVDNGGTVTVTLTGAASKAAYADAIESITFLNSTDNPAANPVRDITVQVSDGSAGSNVAHTRITVIPVNDAPVAHDDVLSVNEDATLVLNLTANDTDVDGDTLHVTSVNGVALTPGVAQSIAVPNGKVNVAADGTMSFVPDANYNGTVGFDYAVVDPSGLSSTAHVQIQVAPVNDAPVVVNDGPVATAPNKPVSGNVLANDSDVDGDKLTVTQISVDKNGDGVADVINVPANGSATVALTDKSGNAIGSITVGPDGAYTFTPAPAYDGKVPAVTYTVSDGTDMATGSLTFQDVPNTAPTVANEGPVATTPNTPVSGNVLANDSDTDGDKLTVTQISIDMNGDGIADLIDVPAGDSVKVDLADKNGNAIGSITVGSNGDYTFTPADAYDGKVPAVGYTVSDGTTTGTGTLTFQAVPNTAPTVASEGPLVTTPNTPVSGNVLTNDSDADGDTLTVTQISIDKNGDGIADLIDVPAGDSVTVELTDKNGKAIGSITVGADGDYTFTPADAYDGKVPAVTYTVSDGTTTANGSLTFQDVPNTAPTLVNDGPVVTTPNTPVSGNVLANDSDADGDTLTVTQISIDKNGDGIADLIDVPAGDSVTVELTDKNGVSIGSITVSSNGDYTFTPADAYDGKVPAVTYTVSDGTTTANGSLTFQDVPNNAPAVANEGPVATTPNTPVSGNVLANDSDADGDTLTVTQISIDKNGDGIADLIDVPAGDSVTVELTDKNGASIGSITVDANGDYTFTPANAYDGKVPAVGYTVSDGTTTASGSLTFQDVPNTAPTLVNDGPIATQPNTPVSGNVLTNDSDADGDTLVVTQISVDMNGDGIADLIDVPAGDSVTVELTDKNGKAIGSITVDGNGDYTFTPADAYDGKVPAVGYTVSDGTTTASGSLTFQDVPNTAPTLVNDGPIATQPNTPVSGNVLTNDSDADGDKLTVTQISIDMNGDGIADLVDVPAGDSVTVELTDKSGASIGSITVGANGDYTFTPADAYDGKVPAVGYTVTDGTTTGTGTLTFQDVPNTAPTLVNDGPVATQPNTPVSGNVLANDSDADGDKLTVTQISIDKNGDGIADLIDVPAGDSVTVELTDKNGKAIGSITVGANGDYTFTPADAYDGKVPAVNYTVSDGTTTANGSLTFQDVPNNAPVVKPEGPVATQPNTPVSGNLLANDRDADGDTLTVTRISVDMNGDGIADLIDVPAGDSVTVELTDKAGKAIGSITVDANGDYTFTPADAYDGKVPAVTYTVSDGTDPSTGSLTFQDVPNNAPTVANEGPVATDPNTPVSGNLLANDSDTDGDKLTVTQISIDKNGDGIADLIDVPAGKSVTVDLTDKSGASIGSITVGSDGAYTFTPSTAYDGKVPAVTYTISDGTDTVDGTLSFQDVPNNAPTVANEGPVETKPNTPVSGNVLANDSDADGDKLTVTRISIDKNGDGIADLIDVPAGDSVTVDLTDNGKSIGSITVGSDGAYTFTPADAYDGKVPAVTYTVGDGTDTVDGTLSFQDVPNNAPTVANEGPIATTPNTPVSGNLLANDSDADGDKLTVTQISIDKNGDGIADLIDVPAGDSVTVELTDKKGASIGSITVGSDGAYTFTPATAYDGQVPAVGYTVSDGTDTSTGSLTFKDVPNNAPTIANDGPVATLPNTPASGNVLANDSDVDGDKLTVTQISIDKNGDGIADLIDVPAGDRVTVDLTDKDGNAIGSITIGSDGAYTFTPAAGFDGKVPATTYTVSDGTTTGTGTLSFQDVPNNAPTVANEGPVETKPNTPVSGNLLANDSDADGDKLTVTRISIDKNGDGLADLIDVPAGDSVTVELTDNAGKAIGSITVGANGDYTFTPADAYDGKVPAVTYTVSDGTDTSTGTLTFQDVPNNAPTVANEGPIATTPNTPVSGNLLANDSDADHDKLTVTQISIDKNGDGIADLIDVPAGDSVTVELTDKSGKAIGSITIGSDGDYTFTPATAYDGKVPTMTYQVSDGTVSVPGTLSFQDVPNTPPVVRNDGPFDTAPNYPEIGNLLANDTDADDDKLTVTQIRVDLNGDDTDEAIDVPANGSVTVKMTHKDGSLIGSLTISSNGDFVFMPAESYHGEVLPVTYTVSDGTTTARGTLSFVDVPNTAPVAANDGPVATTRNSPVSGNVLANDSDANNDVLTVTQISIDRDGDGIPDVITVPANGTASVELTDKSGASIGTLTIGSDGAYTFTPAKNYEGPVPEATYTVTDGEATGTARLSFQDVRNAPPVLAEKPPVETAGQDKSAKGNLLTGDTDPDGDTLTVIGFTVDVDGDGIPDTFTVTPGAPTTTTIRDAEGNPIGTITIGSDGSFKFTVDTGFSGPVPQVVYTVTDGTATGQGTLKIADVPNLPPVIDGGLVNTVDGGKPLNVPGDKGVLVNARDPEGRPLAVTDFTVPGVQGPVTAGEPMNIPGVGVLTINRDGSYSFVPDAHYAGDLQVAFTVSDGQGGTTTGALTLHVKSAVGNAVAFGKATDPASAAPGAAIAAGDVPYRGDYPFVFEPTDDNGHTVESQRLSVQGAVLDAVNAISSLEGNASLDADGVVLQAVNAIDSLHGSSLESTGHSLGMATGSKVVSSASGDNALHQQVEGSALHGRDGFDTPVRAIASLPIGTDLHLELVSRGQQSWLDVSDAGKGRTAIVSVSATLADGKALPSWIRVDGRGHIAIERPVGTDQLTLRITVTRKDGASRTHTVEIDNNAAEMRQLGKSIDHKAWGKDKPAKAADRSASLPFSQQVAQASRPAETVDSALMELLG